MNFDKADVKLVSWSQGLVGYNTLWKEKFIIFITSLMEHTR